jgi:hypothetical protein
MRPWIWPNGKLHVERCSMDQLRLGDIAVWFDGTSFISHRVVGLGAGVLATRADSRTAMDAPVHPSQLLGRAVRFTKGPISYQLNGPLVTFLSGVVPKPWHRLLATCRWARECLRGARRQ